MSSSDISSGYMGNLLEEIEKEDLNGE